MSMPEPTEHHEALKRLAGDWVGTERMYPSEWDPQGGEATGRNRMRMALGGFALITNYEQEREGEITFRGHGVTTYDQARGEYVLHWFDSIGSPPEVFRGNFDGDVLTVAHGGKMHVRLTYDLSREGILGSKMEMSPDGAAWKTLFDCDYERP